MEDKKLFSAERWHDDPSIGSTTYDIPDDRTEEQKAADKAHFREILKSIGVIKDDRDCT